MSTYKTTSHFDKSVKTFLSDETNEYASIAWNVDMEDTESESSIYRNVSAQIRLTDCSKIIYMDFDTETDEEKLIKGKGNSFENRIKKADNLINELLKFKSALQECQEVNKTNPLIKKTDGKKRRVNKSIKSVQEIFENL